MPLELHSRIAEVVRTTAQAWGLPTRPRRPLFLIAV
jgi:hypothetical protein